VKKIIKLINDNITGGFFFLILMFVFIFLVNNISAPLAKFEAVYLKLKSGADKSYQN